MIALLRQLNRKLDNLAKMGRSQPSEMQPRSMYNVDEACQLIGVGRTKLYSLINDKAIDARKLGKRTLIPAAALEKYLTALPDRHPLH